ncbi:MAG: hypothetical protein ACTS3F_02795 [Phycisphaerales bacterium]
MHTLRPTRPTTSMTIFIASTTLACSALLGCGSSDKNDRWQMPADAEPAPSDNPAAVSPTGAGSDHAIDAPPDPPTRAAGAWVPNALASFLTIDRSTSYALIHDPDHAVLIVAAVNSAISPEAEIWMGTERSDNFLWWVVEMPINPSPTQSVELGGRYRAWLLERVAGEPTHGSQATGRATVIAVDQEHLILELDLTAQIAPPGAGQEVGTSVHTSERVALVRRQPLTIPTQEITTTSGAADRVLPVRLPIWTALGPDEWKPAGWEYEQPGRRRQR